MTAETLVLGSGKCSWGGCVFCGYGRIKGYYPSSGNVKTRLREFFGRIPENVDEVKVFGSGSFLDEQQVPADARKYFVEACKENGIKKATIESRPEYIIPENLADFRGIELTVAIGLETADEELLKRINKGFTLSDYGRAAEVIRDARCRLRTYLLVNPPYADDIQGELDYSVEYALRHSDSVVLINTLPHGSSPLFDLWLNGEWTFLSREEFRKTTVRWKNNPRIELDEETFRFISKFPAEKQESLEGVGERYLTHPHFNAWQDYLQRWYTPPAGKDILLLLPCSYRKPYRKSRTHQLITKAIKQSPPQARVHEVMLSNAGVVPREFEHLYPFAHYDWDEHEETPEVKERYIQVTTERITGYLRAHRKYYHRVLCYLKYDSESYRSLEQACGEQGIAFENLLGRGTYEKIKEQKSPLQQSEALADLREGLRDGER